MEKTCTLFMHFDKGTPALANEMKDVPAKVDAMKKSTSVCQEECYTCFHGGFARCTLDYTPLLVHTIQTCAMKFPEVCEIIETDPKLRVSTITRLLDTFYQIRAVGVCSRDLWIAGEYRLSLYEVESGLDCNYQAMPFSILHTQSAALERFMSPPTLV